MNTLSFKSWATLSLIGFLSACSSDSTGTAAGTGGATGETGGTGNASGGASTSGDSGGATECETFCADEATVCTGANKAYADNATCLTDCAGFASGSPTGDTFECRKAHLGYAAGDAALHCQHTAKVSAVCK